MVGVTGQALTTFHWCWSTFCWVTFSEPFAALLLQPLPAAALGGFMQVRRNVQWCYQRAVARHGSFKNLSRCQLNIFITAFLVVQQNPILRCRWWCSSSVKILGRLWGRELKPLKVWPTVRINLSHRKFFIQQLCFESKSIWVNPFYHSHEVS